MGKQVCLAEGTNSMSKLTCRLQAVVLACIAGRRRESRMADADTATIARDIADYHTKTAILPIYLDIKSKNNTMSLRVQNV